MIKCQKQQGDVRKSYDQSTKRFRFCFRASDVLLFDHALHKAYEMQVQGLYQELNSHSGQSLQLECHCVPMRENDLASEEALALANNEELFSGRLVPPADYRGNKASGQEES
jgi:hypothetical protein